MLRVTWNILTGWWQALSPPKSDGSHILPILICKASDNYNNMRADLVRGRPFVAVLTHANILLTHSHQASDHAEHDMVRLIDHINVIINIGSGTALSMLLCQPMLLRELTTPLRVSCEQCSMYGRFSILQACSVKIPRHA